MSFATIPAAAAILFLTGIIPLDAAQYFIDVNGDDRNTGERNAPLKTIPAAVAKITAGDTIIIHAGTYSCQNTITLSKNGSDQRPIALFAATGEERPLLDFSAMAVGDANCGIKLTGSFWHLRGLLVKGAGDNGLLISGGNDNTIEYCDFLENRDTGCQLKGGAGNNRIVNCDSYDNRDPDEGDADGFAPKMDVGSGNVFSGCRAWNNSDDGWDGYLRGADNVSTRLENCWCFKNGFRKDGSASTGNGNGFKMGGSDGKDLRHNFILVRCLAFENRVKGFDQNNNRGAMTLYNCTAFNNAVDYSIDGGSSTLIAVNCIAAGDGSNALKGGTQTTNDLNAAVAEFISVDFSSAKEARRADGSLPDIAFMHLAGSSSLIDAGTVIDGVSYNGAKPDLGCFESGVSSYVEPADRTARPSSRVLHQVCTEPQSPGAARYLTFNGRCAPFPERLPAGAYVVFPWDRVKTGRQRIVKLR